MMQNLLNIARREAERVVARLSMPKTGIVSGYDPANYAAKVRLQPQDVETGWLPIRTPWSGNNWGMFCPPNVGDEVEVQFQEGGKKAPYIALRAFGDQFRPLTVPAGEFWLVHKTGSFLKFNNDGSVAVHSAGDLVATVGGNATVTTGGDTTMNVSGQVNLTAGGSVVASAAEFDFTGDLNVTGTITASGDIYDNGGSENSMNHIRTVYDTHRHSGIQPGGGNTNVPNEQL